MATSDASEEVGGAMPTSPPRENLIRALPDIEVRDTGEGMPTLTGHFAVWDTWTEIRSAYEGNFMERFAPGSMTKTLRESTPKVLFQHGRDPQVGDKPLGTPTRVEPDERGAFYEVAMFDTSYNRDLLPGLQAGAYGASFRFSVLAEDVVQKPPLSDYNPRGIPERTVREARIMEFGPVTFPAYAQATAGVRSMTDEYLRDLVITDELRDYLTSLGGRVEFVIEDLSEPILVSARDAEAFSAITLFRADAPEPSEATTQPEPEPSEATTQTPSHGRFWLVDPPKHLKG